MTTETTCERWFILFFRLAMAWTFTYAGFQQVTNPKFGVTGFLNNTKTFHDIFAPLASPSVAPLITFLVSYGHLLIGLSLLLGLAVRVSASFGALLMLMYWLGHMDWPYIENRNNFILDYHVVYAAICIYLIVKRAGHVWGFDAAAAKLPFVERHAALRSLVT